MPAKAKFTAPPSESTSFTQKASVFYAATGGLYLSPEQIEALGTELIRMGTTMRLHKDLSKILRHPTEQSLLLLAAIECFRFNGEEPHNLDLSWLPLDFTIQELPKVESINTSNQRTKWRILMPFEMQDEIPF